MNERFKISSKFKPAGDQIKAIESLVKGVNEQAKDQVLMGVTGSGKTFTMANIIEQTNRPTLIMAHNKTLAAQLFEEMKEFFPNSAVEYFVSYYDYYQPEAYAPRTDTYIEKDSSINEQIDQYRHSATRALFERRDVIVVASVSCIYGLGPPELYSKMVVTIESPGKISQKQLVRDLVSLQYERTNMDFSRGKFRITGDIIDIFPSHLSDVAWRLSLFGDEIEEIVEIDPLTGKKLNKLDKIQIYANSHFVIPRPSVDSAIVSIKKELKERLGQLYDLEKLVEAQRLDQRTKYDLEMLLATGMCKGIENYSRYLSGRGAGEPPPTLFEYLPKDALLFVDESHVSVPQVGAMYKGDRARKTNLIEYGFRMPSALDNRPLKFEEWEEMRPQTIYVSATPGRYELERTHGEFVEQIIRPTGLVDPVCEIRPVGGQVDDLINECKKNAAKNQRVLVTTLTKKMAENLAEYLRDAGVKVSYLHSEILTLERMEIIQELRRGTYDVLVGINLLREGLDIPECSLVAILDADKEGFLRSETSLVQTIGRAARHEEGRVILYADRRTNSIEKALAETDRRRNIQLEYNKKHNITPRSIIKSIKDSFYAVKEIKDSGAKKLDAKSLKKLIDLKSKEMFKLASDLEFEKAAKMRDEVKELTDLLAKLS